MTSSAKAAAGKTGENTNDTRIQPVNNGHASENTGQGGATYKVYPIASFISEDIEQGDTHTEVTAQRIGG